MLLTKCPVCAGTGEVNSTALTFRDLEEGDLFIFFIGDGDDRGHGGFCAGSRLFKKITPIARSVRTYLEDNAVAVHCNTYSSMPDTMRVIKII